MGLFGSKENPEDVMYKALKAKFTQHPKCKEILLSTSIMLIVEEITNITELQQLAAIWNDILLQSDSDNIF